MDNLLLGVKQFKDELYPEYKQLFESLKSQQSPHTLFIGCSDSRLIPDLITRSMPGELFVVRNIANIVPKYRISEEYLATTSAIEFAVLGLNVKNIVVCGHSNCGGCRALVQQYQFKNMPHTIKWLEQIKEIVDNINIFDQDNMFELIEKQNIILQLQNLMTYPFIKERFEEKTLQLFGWYFDIGTGTVFNYNRITNQFEKLGE
ncbi:MAG TPA: carbonic anhydrase [Candidatus Kapabacteria bacterium]|jgi:carbonic anhydrase|nr:carbonic anhydrase [Candidatus Kapabacteria bacterium]HOQ48733.1 carbonic anhydrase [Candidatus Kapabacteria bacterium]HPU24139.1 carbonic anhydrase [Candidatus Kapabacteria bacterium]